MGWIRQCEKYFQMAGTPEEYNYIRSILQQLYFVGQADVWLRRSGLLKKKLTWEKFCEEVIHSYSGSSNLKLTVNLCETDC